MTLSDTNISRRYIYEEVGNGHDKMKEAPLGLPLQITPLSRIISLTDMELLGHVKQWKVQ
jgi:hypothetical protein